MTDCTILRIDKKSMIAALHREQSFSDLFVSHLLARNIRFEEDLVDQLFNSSEKRLARILLLLAHFGKEDKPEPVIPKISQESLAEMVGTTRSRVSFFMNRFRKLGFVEYDGDGMQVHSSLLNVVLTRLSVLLSRCLALSESRSGEVHSKGAMWRTAREVGSELYFLPHDKHIEPICRSSSLAQFQFPELQRIRR